MNHAAVVYDAAGNVWTDNSTVPSSTYTWDPEGHLTAVSGPATASYSYDALGQRVKAVVNGTTYLYVYDGAGKEFAEINAGTMTPVYTNLWVGSRLFAKYDSVNGTLFVHSDNIGSATTLTGPIIIRSSQCPHIAKFAPDIAQTAADGYQVGPKVVDLGSWGDAQNAPTPYAVFALIYNGRLLADHQISRTRFRNIMSKSTT
jgi:YD repeat-containing protein